MMDKNKDKLNVGDLVTHVLYGRKWIGIIVDFRYQESLKDDKRKTQALVQIQPGTEFEGFFKRSSTADRVKDSLGFVSIHWLFKVREKNGNTRSSRSKTS